MKERGQNNGIFVGGGQGFWLLFAAAEKIGTSVSVLAGACDGRIAFPRPFNIVIWPLKWCGGAG